LQITNETFKFYLNNEQKSVLDGKKIICIYFSSTYKAGYLDDNAISYFEKGKIYCYDKMYKKVIDFDDYFYNYYGCNGKFREIKRFDREVELFRIKISTDAVIRKEYYDKYMTIDTSKSFRSFLRKLQKYVNIDPRQVRMLEKFYNNASLYSRKFDSFRELIELSLLDYVLTRKQLSEYHQNKRLIDAERDVLREFYPVKFDCH